MDELTERLLEYDNAKLPDESTVRKKIAEYISLGLIERVKHENEKTICYSLSNNETDLTSWENAAEFFSETSPLGVIGSFIRNRFVKRKAMFHFKHHYILDALDSEILFGIFTAMTDKRIITIKSQRPSAKIIPLKLYIGTQTGRQYLLGYSEKTQRFCFYRLDRINDIELNEGFNDVPEEKISEFCAHVWGVSGGLDENIAKIKMTIEINEGEEHIIQRLEREKRCGKIERIDSNHWAFSAEIFDALEMLPFIRTFIGRITDLQCSDERVIARFNEDLNNLYGMYNDVV